MTTYVLVAPDFVKTGGMDIANYALGDYLARAGHEVHLVTYRAAPELARYPNVRAHIVPKPANAYSLGGPFLAAGAAVTIRRAGKAARVLVNGGNYPSSQTNWVHYVHAAYVPSTAQGGWRRAKHTLDHLINVRTVRLALSVARTVIANSERTRRDIIEFVGVAESRVRTVYYGIDTERFYPPTDDSRLQARSFLGWNDTRPRIAFIGGLGDRRKGFDVLFDAHRLLCKDPSWDGDLAVVGRGAELPRWQARARDAGIDGRIEFLGFRPDVDVVLRGCDALVAPTRYEAYGLGVHEALCTALPAFVSANSGVAERYPASLHHLLLPDPNDSVDLAARLRSWRGASAQLRGPVVQLAAELRSRNWDDMARNIDLIM